MGATSKGEQRLRSKSDFQRFCAELRTSALRIDELVEALRALAVSELRPTERGRFAHLIARHLGASFPAPDVREVASLEWPTEIAMALRSLVPTQGEPLVPVSDLSPDLLPERPEAVDLGELSREPVFPVSRFGSLPAEGVDLRELSRERSTSLTVVLMGDEDEHRASIERLKNMGIRCLLESSLRALGDVFDREVVVGLVVGASWWIVEDPEHPSPQQRLRSILALSNLCWVKLVRCVAWTSVEEQLPELCMSLHHAHPPRSRLAVEDRATLTDAELRCLIEASQDLVYGERTFSCDFPLSLAQKRILRAATSRYLRVKYPTVHTQESGLGVRTLASRGTQGLASLVSVDGTDVALVVKVSPYPDALEEARRFRLFAHGTSFEMEFFCHGLQGALVFAPIGTRLGQARSLEDMLAPRDRVGRRSVHEGGIPAIDSAIAALQRFSQQLRPRGVDTLCSVESDTIERLLASCGPITVAGEAIDLRRLYARGLQALDRCWSKAAVQHGDAHPGNILFSATNIAVLIDYECAGLGPACYDLSMLWIHVLASQFVAVGDEHSTVGLLRDLLQGVPFDALEKTWSSDLRFAVSQEVVYLAHEAIEASFAVMGERDCTREDVYGVVAIILCREFLNSRLQQFVIRCALAAVSSVLVQKPA